MEFYAAEQVVRYALSIFLGDLVRDDWQPGVELPGVPIDDLAIVSLCKFDGELRWSTMALNEPGAGAVLEICQCQWRR